MWADAEGVRHTIEQHEGGEQGDPSCRYCSVWGSRTPSRWCGNRWKKVYCLFAFLDDIYVFSSPERTRVIYDLLATTLGERVGIQLHTGKTRTWNFAGECQVDMAELGPDVWNPAGVRILGTPVGHDDFVANFLEERLAEGAENCCTQSPQSQTCNVRGRCSSSAQGLDVVICCARFHHDSVQDMRNGHDSGMQRTMEALLGRIPGNPDEAGADGKNRSPMPAMSGDECVHMAFQSRDRPGRPEKSSGMSVQHPTGVWNLKDVLEGLV